MITIPVWLFVVLLSGAAMLGVLVSSVCVGAHRGEEKARWQMLRTGLYPVLIAARHWLRVYGDVLPSAVIAEVALTRRQCEMILEAIEEVP
jgi:hypothetical protein